MPRLRLPGFFESLQTRRAMQRWQAAAEGRAKLDTQTLAQMRPRAQEIERFAHALVGEADRRLQGASGDQTIEQPPLCDWAWRPDPWATALTQPSIAGAVGGTSLMDGVTLFHDCPLAEITLRQGQATDAVAPAPYHLTMDALRFEGSFLSLAIDLPREAALGLLRSHILGVGLRLWQEHPAEVFIRLNVRHGPNTEQLVSELTPGDRADSPLIAEFDLGFTEINTAKLEHAWIDLIFERPEMNLVRLEDLTLTRRPRANV